MTEQSASAHTYAALFPEQLANPCSPDSPESNTGPIAYLHALYQKALELENASSSTTRLTLAKRRPDIGELVIDPKNLEQPISALALAVRILSRHAQERAGASAYLPETLANAGQHVCVPYHQAQEQIKAVLKHRKIPHFELLQQAKYTYPNFCHDALHTPELRQVMRNACGLSPALQALLTDSKTMLWSGDPWRKLYGMDGVGATAAKNALLDVNTFQRRTGLSFEQVLELLAVAGVDDNATSAYTLVRSSTAYQPAGQPATDRYHYGAAYINAERAKPLTIKDSMDGPGIAPMFDALDYKCLPRIYHMIHLQRALGLPFGEVDLLLMSILRAEGQMKNWHVTPTTLSAFGVFRYLNEAYGISAEQFAALVMEINPFTNGEQAPLLDRVLDGPGASEVDPLKSLILDDRAFDPADGAEGQFKVVPALCKALGTSEDTTLIYLAQAKQALGLKRFTVSLTLLSSLYRLSRLHRLLKRPQREADALIALLAKAGTDVIAQLAGKPSISAIGATDVLDTLVALTNLDQWLRQERITPSHLLEALAEPPEADVPVSAKLRDIVNAQRVAIVEAVGNSSHSADGNTQESLAGSMMISLFGNLSSTHPLTATHVRPLLAWSGYSAAQVLSAAITLFPGSTATPAAADEAEKKRASQIWFTLERRCALIQLLRLSPGAVRVFNNNAAFFDLEQTGSHPANLDLCYQLSRFRAWVEVARAEGADEEDVVRYVATHRDSSAPARVSEANQALGALIGWHPTEVAEAAPHVDELMLFERTERTFDDFLEELSDEQRNIYEKRTPKTFITEAVVRPVGMHRYKNDLQDLIDKLLAFIDQQQGTLFVTANQYSTMYDPENWRRHYDNMQSGKYRDHNGYHPFKIEQLPERPGMVHRSVGIACVPSTISDIDFILRLKMLSEKTGLACASLLSLAELDETSSYVEFEGASNLLMAGADDALRSIIETQSLADRRDALAGYLIGHWMPPESNAVACITGFEDLSSYCLYDIGVSSAVQTTLFNQTIGSLQHYLSRLFARLEPGYGGNAPSSAAQIEWQSGLGQYGTWKRSRDQHNHPANLIYYANRPNKSVAFQELEVELNQGKMDTALLHNAICSYLAKFERVSNLQVISGYLDGHDPKQDMYHLIARTNSTPVEYYWRTFDISLRDDQQRLNPLAWSEWEKINVAASAEIAQSEWNGKRCDAVRPVVIAGRRYVFWVERSTTDLPNGAKSGELLANKRKLSVSYGFQQSDGTWSTANELMSLDGYKEGKWESKRAKSRDFLPGLIVVVNDEGERAKDPWLTAMLFDCINCTKKDAKPTYDDDYFIEARDLLLIERQNIDAGTAQTLSRALLSSYKKTQAIQHPYNGKPIYLKKPQTISYRYPHPLHLNKKIEGLLNIPELSGKKFSLYYDKLEDISSHLRHIVENKEVNINQTLYITLLSNNLQKNNPNSETEASPPFTLETKIAAHSKTLTIEAEIKREHQETHKLNIAITPKQKTKIHETIFKTRTRAHIQTFSTEDISEIEILIESYIDKNVPTRPSVDKSAETQDEASTKEIPKEVAESIYHLIAYNYDIEKLSSDETWDIYIDSINQAQYLDLGSVSETAPILKQNKIRLNTLFGKNLVARASQGVERVLAWDTQKLPEPSLEAGAPAVEVDFHGANALYFRELFLHVPALVAMRLTEQQQFEEAEDWYLRYLFNPYRTEPGDDGRPAPWGTRPLAQVGSLSSTLNKDVDVISRVFTLSRHYQQAVYLSLLENWQQQGDHWYRQLTLSTLNQAWLCYQQALQLLGPLPAGSLVSRFSPITLAALNDGAFRRPINPRVIELRKTLERRVHNLRHGLTLDGKPLQPLTWSDESLDAFASTRGGVSNLPIPYRGPQQAIPHYRFRQLLPMAKAAAQQLSDFGRHYMALMEEEFNTSLSVQLKAQDIKMSDFAVRIQKEAIDSIRAKKSTLLLSRDKAAAQKDYLTDLIDVGRSAEEEAATAFTWISNYNKMGSIVFDILAGVTGTVIPTIFGFSNGGHSPQAISKAAAQDLRSTADIAAMISNELKTQADYNRRAAGWAFDKSQVEWDIKILDQQLAETNIELNASTIALAQCEQDRINLQEAYVSMTTGFTIIPVYNWLVARQEQIYGAAYDAVRSLCQAVETAWRYEIGDYRRDTFIDTTAWRENYKGMLMGESLLVNLQQMENEYLLKNERRLTIKKSFSLKKKLGEATWGQLFTRKTSRTAPFTHNFAFNAADFDRSYPGQYLRQLKYVSVTFILKNDVALDELCATLTQTGSTTLLEANEHAARSLYPSSVAADTSETVDTVPQAESAGKDPKLVLRNPSVKQQIALSSAVAEDGLGYDAGTWVYELMFHDGRYLPFEGTGAISEWSLEILGNETLLEDLSVIEDIKINMVYTAKAGDEHFTSKVRSLLKAAKGPLEVTQ